MMYDRPTAAYSHLALSVADLDRATSFYVNALGFAAGVPYRATGRRVARLMESPVSGFDGVFLRLGDTLLELLAHRDAEPPGVSPRMAARVGMAHISFVVNDIEAALARILSAGGRVRTRMEYAFADPSAVPTSIAFCLDLDGNRVELIAHPSLGERDRHRAHLGLDPIGWPAAEGRGVR